MLFQARLSLARHVAVTFGHSRQVAIDMTQMLFWLVCMYLRKQVVGSVVIALKETERVEFSFFKVPLLISRYPP